MKAKYFKCFWYSLLSLATEDVIDELPFVCGSWQFEVLDKSVNLITCNVPQKQFKYILSHLKLWETFWSPLEKTKTKRMTQHLKW